MTDDHRRLSPKAWGKVEHIGMGVADRAGKTGGVGGKILAGSDIDDDRAGGVAEAAAQVG